MKISIIIPNYNGEELLKKNLPKVFEAAEYYVNKHNTQIEIVIVDDCSTDNSVEEIKYQISNFPAKQDLAPRDKNQKSKIDLRLFRNDHNLGFASTVNRGVKEANGEVVVLLNTDVIPEKIFLHPLLSHFEDEKIFAVGCMDKSIEDGKTTLRGRGIGEWQRGFLVHSRGEVDKTSTLWVNGGSGAFRKSIWQSLGGFNPLYNPFYWEDIDISYRALKSGYKMLFDPKSIVVHRHEEGAIKKIYSPLKIKTISYRNQFMFVWMNTSDADLLLSHLLWLPFHFFKMLVLRDWAFYIGFVQAFKNLYKVLNARKQIQRNVKTSDKSIVSQFAKRENSTQLPHYSAW